MKALSRYRDHLRASWGSAAVVLLLSALTLCTSRPVFAQEASKESYPHGMSEYEWGFASRAASELGLKITSTAEAEGRRITSIQVVTYPVFAPEDDLAELAWANAFHVTSQPDVIKREVLLKEGEAYTSALANESSRNLRNIGVVLAMARVLPAVDAKGQLHILVVTKDLWSLRLSYAYSFVDNALLSLYVAFSETNLFGRHKYAAGNVLLEQDTLTLGQVVQNPRVFGSRVRASESFALILNRDSGDYEGFNGLVSVGQPLYSLATPWAWSVSGGANRSIVRIFQGKDIFASRYTGDEGDELLPWKWRAESETFETSVTRSFGRDWKNNTTVGYQLYRTKFTFGEDDAEADMFSAGAQAAMQSEVLPRSELASGVFLEHAFFQAKYHALRNFDTFALPEDTREGPSLSARLLHSDPLVGADKRFQTLSTLAVYRFVFDGDDPERSSRHADVLSFSAGYGVRRLEDGTFVDHGVTTSIRNYSPVVLGGRFVSKLAGSYRYRDEANAFVSIGGDSGLRGYPATFFTGKNRASGHLEYRTMPGRWRAFHFGAVVFYDAGVIGTRENLSDLEFLHDIGFGVRALNPLSNKVVWRADYAFPLSNHLGTLPGTFSSGFEQAF